MADSHIGALPLASDIYDDSLLVMEQQGTSMRVTGKTVKRFAERGVEEYVESAKDAANSAASSATEAGAFLSAAQAAQTGAENAKADAETALQGAQEAREAIENMTVSAEPLGTGEPASVDKTTVDGVVNLHFGLPAGAKGDTGATGSSIQSIERTGGNGAAGSIDTYTITLTDGSTSQFQVYNGADGEGAGDMLKSVYDPQNKETDIFSYVDNAVGNFTPLTNAEIDAIWESAGTEV